MARTNPTLARLRRQNGVLLLFVGMVNSSCVYDVTFARSKKTAAAGGNQAQGGTSSTGQSGGGNAGTSPSSTSVTLPAGTTWQWQITGEVDTTVAAQLFVVELFEVTDAALAQLKARKNQVICGFSAGTNEPWRTDMTGVSAVVLGNAVVEAPEETWLDIRAASVRQLMVARLEYAVTRGCNGVLLDSVDGYDTDTGFSIGTVETLDYLAYLSSEAKNRGLSLGLANCAELVGSAEPLFDFSVQLRCLEYDECDAYTPFLDAEKPVLHAEIVSDETAGAALLPGICQDARRSRFSTILKLSSMNAWRLSCD